MNPTDTFNADCITIDNPDVLKCKKRPIIIHCIPLKHKFSVTTKEGQLNGKSGDYLMFGIDGEKYPCDKEIFEKTYDLI